MKKTIIKKQQSLDARNILLEVKKDYALLCAPITPLHEILQRKTVADLKKLAAMLPIKNYSAMRKAELIDVAEKELLSESRMEDALLFVTNDEWDFFRRVVDVDILQDDNADEDDYLTLQDLGILQSFVHEDHVYFVIPDELRKIYIDLAGKGISTKISLAHLLDKYVRATVNLYGIISQEEFVQLFNTQNPEYKISTDEVFKLLISHIYYDDSYYFWGKYITHGSFAEDDFESVKIIEQNIAGKPRYIPDRSELLNYSDPGYYEQTPQNKALKRYIRNFMMRDSMMIELIMGDIAMLAASEAPMQEIIDLFDEYDIVFDSTDQLQQLIPMVIDLYNHSRIWSNKGHTPAELSGNNRPYLKVLEGGKTKPGRNSPCPCGSGKKYKNCCGRLDS